MGLAMVHGIIHDHGGHIQVYGNEDVGADIRIRLPARFPPGRVRQAHPRAPAQREVCTAAAPLQGHILLAEDEPSVQELMCDLLTSWGLRVTLASNGIDACERFASDPDGFDLALLDQIMPRMTGLEAAEQLGKLRPDLPMILYTGYSEQVPRARLAAAGVRSLLRKPVDTSLLRDSLAGMLDGR
jgi:CheY-like chemotaxis protein